MHQKEETSNREGKAGFFFSPLKPGVTPSFLPYL